MCSIVASSQSPQQTAIITGEVETEWGREYRARYRETEYRLISAEHGRSIIEARRGLEAMGAENAALRGEVEALKRQVALGEERLRLADERSAMEGKRFENCLAITSRQSLLIEQQQQLLGRRGPLDKLFGSTAWKIGTEFGFRGFQTYLMARQK